MSRFALSRTDSSARTGKLSTAHGTVETPIFCPVGSQATVKTLSPDEIEATGSSMILANTYHLYLRPGIEVIGESGGLHNFMDWKGPILTDSGGFQVFSLARLIRTGDSGIIFKSHIDGGQHFFSPEIVVDCQEKLGSDIMMVLDECLPHDAPGNELARAVERTSLWARRSLDARTSTGGQLFAIVQGGTLADLRQKSARQLAEMDFEGYAIGGLSLGEPKELTFETAGLTARLLPPEKPRYLMGVGSPEDLVRGVEQGIDIFDSVLPTRVARNGGLYTRDGRINILNARFKDRDAPLMQDCPCYMCRRFSLAYISHLFRAGELLGLRLATIHNLTFIQTLMLDMRKAISQVCFGDFRQQFFSRYRPASESARAQQKQKWLARRLEGQ